MPLEIINRKILNAIFNKPRRFPTYQLCRELSILSVTQVASINILKYSLRKQLIQFLPSSELTRLKKDKFKAIVPKRRSNVLSESCHTFIGPRIFNLLPTEIRKTFYYDASTNHINIVIE